MGNILLRACALVTILIIGIIMHMTGFLGDEAGGIVKKILMSLTLPAAIITNFSRIDALDGSMIILILMGIGANSAMILIGAFLARNKTKDQKALYMNCLPAYNIGAFCLPYIQNFMPAMASVTACLFDAGNSIMCTGGTYSIVAEYLSEHKGSFKLSIMLKRLISSMPLMTYLVMITISLLHIKLPNAMVSFVSPAASANPFIAMFMLGLLFRMEKNKSYLASIAKLLGIRHLFNIAFALFCYYILPFDLIVRQGLVLISFGPMSAVAPLFTELCGGDEGLASAANSISIILSVIEITLLIMLMGIY